MSSKAAQGKEGKGLGRKSYSLSPNQCQREQPKNNKDEQQMRMLSREEDGWHRAVMTAGFPMLGL